MALAATGVLEVRTGGSDSNAGYFNPGGGSPGTDYSQQDAAQVTIDGAAITATVQATTTQLLIAGVSVTSAWNRNGLRITGGTATAGLYEITAVNTGTNVVTLDRSAGTSTQTATGAMGGGLASPGQAGAFKVAGMLVYVKAGTYTLSGTSVNTSGGPVSDTTGGASNGVPSIWVGYDSTRSPWNTDASRPTILVPGSGVSSVTVFATSGGATWVHGIIVDGASKTSVAGFMTAAAGNTYGYFRCKAQNCTNSGFTNGRSNVRYVLCEATGCSSVSAFVNTGGETTFVCCYAHDNTVPGFNLSTGQAFGCVADTNTGGSSYGFGMAAGNGGPVMLVGCVAYNNGASGFSLGNSTGVTTCVNCVAVSNAAYGFLAGTIGTLNPLLHCATYGNTSGATNNYAAAALVGAITLSGDPFANSAGGTFTPNITAGAGAALRAAGFPAALSPSGGTSYPDVGAFQHQDAGGGGATVLGGFV